MSKDKTQFDYDLEESGTSISFDATQSSQTYPDHANTTLEPEYVYFIKDYVNIIEINI